MLNLLRFYSLPTLNKKYWSTKSELSQPKQYERPTRYESL